MHEKIILLPSKEGFRILRGRGLNIELGFTSRTDTTNVQGIDFVSTYNRVRVSLLSRDVSAQLKLRSRSMLARDSERALGNLEAFRCTAPWLLPYSAMFIIGLTVLGPLLASA